MVTTIHKTPLVRATNKKLVIPLYDLNAVARFLHSVAYIQVTADNTKYTPSSWIFGSGEMDAGDPNTIRKQAEQLSSNLMNHFSMLCKTGSRRAVSGFLEHQRLLYKTNWNWINSQYSQFNQANSQLQRDLAIATDTAHIVHGTADAAFTVLSLVVTPGAGLAGAKLVWAQRLALAANRIHIADNLISAYTQRGTKEATKEALKDVVDHEAEKTADKYWPKAINTLTNIGTRNWKYQGALSNAEVRLVKQSSVAAAASGVHIFFAALSLVSLKDDAKEIGDAVKDFNHLPAPNDKPVFGPAPDIQVPSPRR